MGRLQQTYAVVRFLGFELNPHTGELRKNGVRLNLQEQPFKVLVALLERPGEMVTREELRQLIWPQESFGDFDHAINRSIAKLRGVLGDSSEVPHLIETLPRRGYRFIAPVDGPPAAHPTGQAQAECVPTPLAPQAERKKSALWWRWPAIAGVQPTAAATRWPFAKPVGLGLLILAFVVTLLVALNVGNVRQRLLSRGAAPRIESLAVLPLQNLSGDKEQDYFVEGLTDELITNLAKISSLKVISRTSVMQYKDTKKPLPQIAKELDVDAVVEGSVLRSGNRVRIAAQLIQASSDRHLWAETYDRDLRDILTLQSDIAAAIGNEVRAKLTPQDQRLSANARPVNPEAYLATLKARYFMAKWTAEGNRKCAEYSQQAVDIDPEYAAAHASLADCYTFAGISGLQFAREAFPKGKAAAGKALQLDETLAEAHAALGFIKLVFDWDWPGSEQEFKRAIELNPSSSNVHMNYGVFLSAMGRSEEAIKETRIALELDPLTPSTNVQLGWVLYYARQHDESIAQLKKALELAPDFGYANMELAWNYAQKRMYPEAVRECRKAVSLAPEEQVTLGACGYVYGSAGRRQDALALLDRLKKLSIRGHVDPYNFAWLYDALGDNNPTMEWLERAYRERSSSLYGLRVEVWSDGLRSDPRFQELVRRMNFPP